MDALFGHTHRGRAVTVRLTLGLLLACVFVVPAHAQTTGNDLLNWCESFLNGYRSTGPTTFQNTGGPTAWQCLGYMASVQSFAYFNLDGRQVLELSCLPNGVSVTQLIRIGVNYGHQHPETLQETSVTLAINSLISAFPCKK
jgi:hypothetical protein